MKPDLKAMCNGAIQEKFENSFGRVMENMQDVNTPYKDKREIIIKMSFVQNEQRDNVVVDIKVQEKLSTQSAMTTQFAVGKDLRTGEVIAEEYGKQQLRGQTEMNIAAVDTETGEVIGNVVDLRKAQGE